MTDLNIPDIVIKYYNDNVKDKDYEDWAESNFFVIENILGSDSSSKESSSDDDIVEEFYNTYMSSGLETWYKKMTELFPNLTQTIIEQNNKQTDDSGEEDDVEDVEDDGEEVVEDVEDDGKDAEDSGEDAEDVEDDGEDAEDSGEEEVEDVEDDGKDAEDSGEEEVEDDEDDEEDAEDSSEEDDDKEKTEETEEESGSKEDRYTYELPNPVKIVVHVHLKTRFKYIMVGNLINDENLKPIFELLERTQSYDSLNTTQTTAINNSVLYYDRLTPSIKLKFKDAWGNISNDMYIGVKFIGASINYMYDTFKDISDIIYGTCKGDVHMPLIPESCFYYVKIKTDNQYIKTHLLLSTNIENGMNKDIVYQKIYAYLVEINCPAEIIKFFKNEINDYTDDIVININEMLTSIFDKIDDTLSYKQLGYFYKSRKYENNIYISEQPQLEYSLDVLNTSISDKLIYRNNPSQIIAELPLIDNVINIIQVKDLVDVLESKDNFKMNETFITNYLAYYYPQIRTVQQLKKLLNQ